MSMMTRLIAPMRYEIEAPPARLVSPEITAARRSALARSLMADMAISRPSDETAIASSTPAVPEVNESRSQLKVCASWLSSTVPLARYASGFGFVIVYLHLGPDPGSPARHRTRTGRGCPGPV